MKKILLIFAFCGLMPCYLTEFSEFTEDILTDHFDLENTIQYPTYVFYSETCGHMEAHLNSNLQFMNPDCVEHIQNVQQNYTPWCKRLATYMNQTRDVVVPHLHSDYNDAREKAGQEIDFTYNKIKEILVGCDESVVNNFLLDYSEKVRHKITILNQWHNLLGGMSEMIPQYRYEQVYYDAINIASDPDIDNHLEKLIELEYRVLKDVERSYYQACDTTKWFFTTISTHSTESFFRDLDDLNVHQIVEAKKTQC